MTEITPARLLELAERAEAFAEASLPSDNEERAAFDEEHAAFADALRAAADQIEALTAAVAETDHWVEAFKEQGVRADAAEATLAARDALLGRAQDELLRCAVNAENSGKLISGGSVRATPGTALAEIMGQRAKSARVLAGEIAAALGAGIPPNTDDVKEKDNG